MIVTNGLDISGKDCFGRREDLSFIVRFHWKTSDHLKEAIQVLLAARLSAMSEGDSYKVRRRSELLDEMEFEQIRMQIASNPNTPPAVLAYLAKAASPKVLERIAENPRASDELLAVLAINQNAAVRAAVGENPNTPADVLVALAEDCDPDVRYRLAENPSMPDDVLLRLAEDANPYVASRAQATLGKLKGGCVVRGAFGTVRAEEHVAFR